MWLIFSKRRYVSINITVYFSIPWSTILVMDTYSMHCQKTVPLKTIIFQANWNLRPIKVKAASHIAILDPYCPKNSSKAMKSQLSALRATSAMRSVRSARSNELKKRALKTLSWQCQNGDQTHELDSKALKRHDSRVGIVSSQERIVCWLQDQKLLAQSKQWWWSFRRFE